MGGKLSNLCSVSGASAEVVFFLYKTGESMLDATIRPYIVDTVCTVNYPQNSTICENLDLFPDEENMVQKEASHYVMYYRILVNVPAIFLGLFCGAWSDQFGRKIPMMIPSLGSVLAVLLYMISLVSFPNVLGLVLAGAALQGIMGKSSIITMAVNSFVSDTTQKFDRTRKLGKLQAMNFFGLFVGSLMSGAFLEASSIQTTFCVVIVVHSICIIVAILCVQESVKHPDDSPIEDNKPRETNECLALFKPSNIRDSLMVLVRNRKSNLRPILIVLFTMGILNQTCKSGELDVTVLFVDRSPLRWPKSWYGYLLAVDYCVMGFCLFMFLPILTNLFKLSDISIIIIAILGRIVRLVWASFATKTWMMFVSVIIGALGGLIVSGVRSLLSKSVDEHEQGKIFALLASGETASKLLGTVIFTNIYAETLHLFPGLAYLIEALFYVVMFFMMVWVYKESKVTGAYNMLEVFSRQYTLDFTPEEEERSLVEKPGESPEKYQPDKKTVRFNQTDPLLSTPP